MNNNKVRGAMLNLHGYWDEILLYQWLTGAPL
jgi:hypothetical protein